MILPLFITLQVFVVVFFIFSYFTKSEVAWAITLVLSGLGMFSSYNLEMPSGAVESDMIFMGINLLFFALSILMLFLDLFDKYGLSINIFNK